jgi:hypothetical protein
MRRRLKKPRVVGLVLAVIAAVGAVCDVQAGGAATDETQAPPVRGATYKGNIDRSSGLPVTFKVSSNGKTISDVQVAHPLQCYLGKYYLPSVSSGSAVSKINRVSESFKVTMRRTIGSSDPQLASDTVTVTVSGEFRKHGVENGSITTTQGNFVANPEFPSSCNASGSVSSVYATRALKHA